MDFRACRPWLQVLGPPTNQEHASVQLAVKDPCRDASRCAVSRMESSMRSTLKARINHCWPQGSLNIDEFIPAHGEFRL